MWCIHTSTALEKRGIPTVTIATDGMADMGQQTARELGFDAMPILTVPHAASLMTEPEIEKVAESIVDQIIYILSEPAEKLESEFKDKYHFGNVRKSAALASCPVDLSPVNACPVKA